MKVWLQAGVGVEPGAASGNGESSEPDISESPPLDPLPEVGRVAIHMAVGPCDCLWSCFPLFVRCYRGDCEWEWKCDCEWEWK